MPTPPRRLQSWAWLHKWSSLVCTLFLLVICVTGLPLVFSEEIDHWLEPHSYQALPAGTPPADIDAAIATARSRFPQEIITSVYLDDEEPEVVVSIAPSWAAVAADEKVEHFMRFDSRTGQLLEQSPTARRVQFMDLMFRLHTDMFAGLAGELFLGVMALLFVIAIVSGVVLYEPFTRRLEFGTVRRRRSARVRWLDLHNLLGVVTVGWALVVGATGLINELATPLFGLFMSTDVAQVLKPWQQQLPPAGTEMSSAQVGLQQARNALPGMLVTNITYPGSPYGSAHHYVFWAKGATPLTGRLYNLVLVDARTGQLTAAVHMPWYLRILEVSRPLHFGDYGGLPLKAIWAALDGVTIVVLGSGVYLWLSRRRSPIRARLSELQQAAGAPAAGSPAANIP